MVRTLSTMLPLGTSAPPFSLVDTDGKTVSLTDFHGSKGLLVVFLCNHCPYVKHVANELKRRGRTARLRPADRLAVLAKDLGISVHRIEVSSLSAALIACQARRQLEARSEEHTSELQSL